MISQQACLAYQDSAVINFSAMPAANLAEFINQARILALTSDYWRGLYIRANYETKRRAYRKKKPLRTTAMVCKGFLKRLF